ncbi:hypothetical protein [Kitasatospora sp. MAP5-34]|uniref:hypothetical protein n=1 Tax=Kitasatospora sp. MAP5-34 TaxID=3035102 RepID=UPI002476BE37|nr:hypothetical protein [Kitasatospora sp. MAP5-34]
MTSQRPALTASAKKAAAMAALMLAATGVAALPAWADSTHTVLPCMHGSVKLPGETPVAGGPAHHGAPTLNTSLVKVTSAKGETTFEVRSTATNHTGAAYQHVTLVPSFFTTLGVMNGANTAIQWVHDGTATTLAMRLGCDPTVFVDSAALDAPLADGRTVSYDLRITTATAVAEQVTNDFLVSTGGAADGQTGLTGNPLNLTDRIPAKPSSPTPQPTATRDTTPAPTTHTSAPAAPAAPSTPPPATNAQAATTATPNPTTSQASLASTGGGSGSGTLLAGAAALTATGAAVLFGLKRRARRAN